VRTLIRQNRHNKLIALPTSADMVKFAEGLKLKLDAAIAEYVQDPSASNYRAVQVTAMVRAIQFNRRRGQDVASTTPMDVETAQTTREAMNTESWSRLSEEEKEIAAQHKLIVVNGKRNRNNFMLLDLQLDQAFTLIIEKRGDHGVLEANPHLFALTDSRDAFLRHSPQLKRLAEEIGVTNDGTVQMRKYLATTFQATKPSEIDSDQLACHFCHDLVTHRAYYRLQDPATELGKISATLHLADRGALHLPEDHPTLVKAFNATDLDEKFQHKVDIYIQGTKSDEEGEESPEEYSDEENKDIEDTGEGDIEEDREEEKGG